MYQHNEKREPIIDRFFKDHLDTRRLEIQREELPSIDVYSTKLLEETINVGKSHLEFENLLFIVGKRGIGKSHFVNCLSDEYKNNLI